MRIDVYLTQNGHAASRTRARSLIEAGLVKLDGVCVDKAALEIDELSPHTVEVGEDIPYVGRGGCKLEAALEAFDLSVTGAVALDIGASTGGFTDCLLRRGAARVYAVDAGADQLAPALRADGRVVVRERCNARYLTAEMLDDASVARGGADIIVMDVSFISQTYIHPVLPALLAPDGCAIVLIKPQFEVGREHLGKRGIVRESKWRRAAVMRVLESAQAVGLLPRCLIRSPIEGGDGNVEFLALLSASEQYSSSVDTEHLPMTFFS